MFYSAYLVFCSSFNAYNLKPLLGPNITITKILIFGFLGIISQTIFLVLQSDSPQQKPTSPKQRRKHYFDSRPPHSQNNLKLIFSPVHNNSNKHTASTLPTYIYERNESPVTSNRKPEFQSLHSPYAP